MTTLETIFEELRHLPPDRLARVADYVHQLRIPSSEDRRAALLRSAGTLSDMEADELQRIIDRGCEQIDERDW